MRVKSIVGAIVAVFALIAIIISNPVVMVDAGRRGVVLNWGAVSDLILNEGLNWRTPIKQDVIEMDVTTQKIEKETNAASKDLQSVSAGIAINYHLDPLRVNYIYQNFRREYDARIVQPAIEEYTKKVTAQFTAEQLVTKREEVKETLKDALTQNLGNNGIIVTDLFITSFSFSKEYDQAIEAKVTAEQRALKAKNDLERVKFEAEQKLATARAEAESIRIQAEAVTQQGGKDYVQLKAVEKWDGKLPVQMIPEGAVPFLNLK